MNVAFSWKKLELKERYELKFWTTLAASTLTAQTQTLPEVDQIFMKDDRDWGFFNRKLWTLNNELPVGVTKFWWSQQRDRVKKLKRKLFVLFAGLQNKSKVQKFKKIQDLLRNIENL